MRHLKDVENFDEILRHRVSISEKIDGSAFIVKVLENGEVEYYQREEKNKIDYLTRVRIGIYDYPIEFFNDRGEILKKKFKGYVFYFEYFFKGIDPIIPPKRIPKNRLILNVVKRGNKIINDRSELYRISDLLDVDRPRILFQGKLKEYQVEEIEKYLRGELEVDNFGLWFKGVIDPQYELFGKNNKTEGFVVTDLGTGELYKIVDYKFTDTIRSKKKKQRGDEVNKVIKEIVKNFRLDDPSYEDYDNGVNFQEKVINLIIENLWNKKDEIYREYGDILDKVEVDKRFLPNLNLVKNSLIKKFNNWMLLLFFIHH